MTIERPAANPYELKYEALRIRLDHLRLAYVPDSGKKVTEQDEVRDFADLSKKANFQNGKVPFSKFSQIYLRSTNFSPIQLSQWQNALPAFCAELLNDRPFAVTRIVQVMEITPTEVVLQIFPDSVEKEIRVPKPQSTNGALKSA